VLSTHAPLGFYQATHLVSFPAKVLMVEALVVLGLSIWLAPRLGLTGVALATSMPALFMSALVLPPYLCRQLEVPIPKFIAASILPGGVMFVATSVVLYLSGLVVTADSYPAVVLRVAISVPVALLVFVVTFPAEERQAFRGLLQSLQYFGRGLRTRRRTA
jgi:hypothetical protein